MGVVDRELNKLYSMARSKDELLLGCWCGENNPCHAQVIKDHLDWKIKSEGSDICGI